jgi:hypothetical protein
MRKWVAVEAITAGINNLVGASHRRRSTEFAAKRRE